MSKKKLTVGLFNDSFPPTIDGVANVTLNYAHIISKKHGNAIVATPFYPKVKDEYPFEVIRYPSAYVGHKIGYRAGNPFDIKTIEHLASKKMDIIHTHCPAISTFLARFVRLRTNAPIVLTHHSKFDVDINQRIAFDPLRKMSLKLLLSNVNACDEVWVVSEGAGENLRSLGYKGSYIVMPNGTDFEKRRSSDEELESLRIHHSIPNGIPVFLFVGRMMWYKGIKLILHGLKTLKDKNIPFKMIFVGDGLDRSDIEKYTKQLGLADDCIFTGAITSRSLLRVYFSLANLFLFPSTYDTNGIVVREAAACSCASLLIKGSCAAEGITDGDTGIVIEETDEAMSAALISACADLDKLAQLGQNAADKIYISWEDAVERAYKRYEVIIENAKNRAVNPKPLEELLEKTADTLVENFKYRKQHIERILYDANEWVHDTIEETLEQIWSRYKLTKHTVKEEIEKIRRRLRP